MGRRQHLDRSARKTRRSAFTALAGFVLLLVVVFVWRPPDLLLWIKAFHIVAVIAWMAGMLYLPRLFVYHSETQVRSAMSETLKVMERRLADVIMRPAMVLTWGLGLWLAYAGFGFQGWWLWLKIMAVVALSGVHGFFLKSLAAFENDGRVKSARYWRMMNEVPTVLMIAIILLVVIKPFQ